MALLFVLEVFLTVLCIFFLYSLNKNDGLPTSFPVVGMLPDIILNLHRFHDYVAELLHKSRCTFLFKSIWFAGIDILFTCDPANIHHVLSSNFPNFPKGSEFKQIFDILGDGIFNADQDLWKIQRNSALAFMKQPSFLKFLVKTSLSKVEKGLIPILEHVSSCRLVVDLQDLFQRFTFDTTCILVTGYDPGSLSVEFPEFQFSTASDDAEKAIFYRHLKPRWFAKLQKWLNIGEERKLAQAWETLDRFITEYINIGRKREKFCTKDVAPEDCDEGIDLLSWYINHGDTITGLNCDDKFLRDTILNFLIAGLDTTSAALSWFAWLISNNPRVENEIINELKSRLQKGEETSNPRIFSIEQVKDLRYLHGALCEALRLYPPVPLQHKRALQPDVLPSGHQVYPETKIILSLYSMGRMESIWGEACLEFMPERWFSENGGIKHEPSYKFMVFNAGPRTCLGKEVVFTQMKVAAAAFIYNYKVSLVEGHPVSPAVSVILSMTHGLKVKISKRFP